MAASYREILTTPGIPALLSAGFIARLPQAMVGIGLLTMLVQQTGLYSLAGGVAGTFTLANALVSPQISKQVDRYGQSRVLPVVTVFSILMLLALIWAAHQEAPAAIMFILAALAGTMPNMPSMLRARWACVFGHTPRLRTAYALDAVLAEMTYVIGPPLVIGLSVGLFAEAGPLLAVALLAVGMAGFLAQRRTEPPVVERRQPGAARRLNSPALRGLVLGLAAMGVIGGAFDVALIAFAKAQGWPTSASYMLGAYALGSMLTGLAYGAVRIAAPLQRQLLIAVVLLATATVLPGISTSVYMMTVMICIAGMAFSPAMIIILNLGTVIVPPAQLTEGLTWMSAGVSVGVASGAAVAGLLIDAHGAPAGFAVAVVAGVVMVAVAFAGRNALDAASTHEADPIEAGA